MAQHPNTISSARTLRKSSKLSASPRRVRANILWLARGMKQWGFYINQQIIINLYIWLVVLTILKNMKVNGKDYPIHEMENKKCLKPPTSNKSIYTIYRYLNYIYMIWYDLYVWIIYIYKLFWKPSKLVHLQTIYLQRSDKTINFATFTHQSISIMGYNPIPLIWWFNCYAMVNMYPLFTPTNHWPIDLNGDHLIHTPNDPMVSGWNHIFGFTYCVPSTKLTRTLNISTFLCRNSSSKPLRLAGS